MKRTIASFGFLIAMYAGTMFAAAQTAPVSLTDPKWNLIAVKGVEVKSDTAHLRFDAQTGKLHGSSGCNFIGGSYKANGSNLKIFQFFITRRACQDPEVEKVEKEFLKVFFITTSFSIHDDVLRLYKGDELTLTFKAGPTAKSN